MHVAAQCEPSVHVVWQPPPAQPIVQFALSAHVVWQPPPAQSTSHEEPSGHVVVQPPPAQVTLHVPLCGHVNWQPPCGHASGQVSLPGGQLAASVRAGAVPTGGGPPAGRWATTQAARATR